MTESRTWQRYGRPQLVRNPELPPGVPAPPWTLRLDTPDGGAWLRLSRVDLVDLRRQIDRELRATADDERASGSDNRR